MKSNCAIPINNCILFKVDPNQQFNAGQPGYAAPPPGFLPGHYDPRAQPAYPMPPGGYPTVIPIHGGPDPNEPRFFPQNAPLVPQSPPLGRCDPEDPTVKGFDFSDETIRKGFIRKVYSILCVCLVYIVVLLSKNI